MTQELAEVGEFCPNEDCKVYGQIEGSHIVRYGRTAAGVQRYQCRVCGKSFTATKGTLFYRKQTPVEEIVETLALLAEGVRISSIKSGQGLQRRHDSGLAARSGGACRAGRSHLDGPLSGQPGAN